MLFDQNVPSTFAYQSKCPSEKKTTEFNNNACYQFANLYEFIPIDSNFNRNQFRSNSYLFTF